MHYLEEVIPAQIEDKVQFLATKEDMDKVEAQVENVTADLKEDIASVKTELSNVRGELKEDIANVKGELKEGIANVKAEVANVITEVANVRADHQMDARRHHHHSAGRAGFIP